MVRLWKPLSIVAGLLLLLTYLLIQSRNPDLARRAHMQEALQNLQLHDTELTRDVLLARAGLLPNYDSLPQIGQQLSQIADALRAESTTVSGAAAKEMGKHAEALTAALQQKLTLVEYFKSDNALLQNSLRYFTHTGQNIGKQFKAEQNVAAEIAAVSHVLVRFIHTSELGAGKEAEAALSRLSANPRKQPGLDTLIAHGWLIVEMLPRVDTLLRQIIAAPTTAHADALQNAVLQYANRVEARAQLFRVLLYLVAVILLGYLFYQFARLRSNARDLRRANTDLEREMGERQQAVAALRASEERFRAITESANDAIISADSSGNIVSWNARAEAIFGYTAEEILGTPFTRLMPTRHHLAHLERFRQWSTTGSSRLVGTTVEFSGVRKDGSEFPLEISLSTWSTAHDNYVTGIIRDLTAQKQLQETTRQQKLQLIQANKMTALGTLVSSVAHEINNPNQVVLMNSRVLAQAWDDAVGNLDDYAQEHGSFSLGGLPYSEMRRTVPTLVQDVHDGARRIERIVDDLKHFSRPRGRGAHTALQLNEAVERALRLLAHLVKNRTDRLQVGLAQGLPSLPGDAQHVEQIVVNLLTNAVEALPNRKRGVTVTTSFDASKRCVVLEVRDEGVGIPPEHLARLCDPFFTTKQESGGTGLGLAITSSLVRLHGGRLTFDSEPGKGTRARVTFPCHSEEKSSLLNLSPAREE
ncbi:MAG TPA: DAHL domain-containing protein [Blastocatellia bacterium]|jgi:PAS domain S-box-containing protein